MVIRIEEINICKRLFFICGYLFRSFIVGNRELLNVFDLWCDIVRVAFEDD